MDRSIQHVYPTFGRPHDTDGQSCWCRPLVWAACSQCDEGDSGCWKCGGEFWIDATADDIAGDVPLCIVHRPLPAGVKVVE